MQSLPGWVAAHEAIEWHWQVPTNLAALHLWQLACCCLYYRLKEQLHPGFCIEVRDRVAFENARKLTEHFGSASVGQPDAPISFADQGQQLCSQVLGQQSPVYPAVPDGAALLTPQRQRFDAAQAAKLTAALDHERKLQGINPVLEHLARRHLQRQQAGRCTVTREHHAYGSGLY